MMMKIRQNFLDYIAQVKAILEKDAITDTGLTELQNSIENVELIIPVVGGFSTGKSTLINSFLGESLLLTNVTPETALATELRYSSNNYIEAVRTDNSIERHELGNMENLRDNASQYNFLRLYLHNENLKAIEPLVLVDMPGFDSPIANHNKAILDYLNKGCYFIFLTGVDEGNISRSMLRQIESIQLFAKDFSFCISKTNLRAPCDVREVHEMISNQLDDYFDFNKEIVLLDDNGGDNLKKILTNIDPQLLFASLFIDALKDNYILSIENINIMISALRATKETSEEALATLQDGIDSVIHKKQIAIAQIESRYSASNIDAIVNRVSQTLMQNKDHLIDLALSSQSAFSNELNDLVKNNLLNEVQARFQSIRSDIVKDFRLELQNSLSGIKGFDFNDGFMDRLQKSTETLIKNTQNGLNDLARNDKENATMLYRITATILGLTTSVVAPILEAILIFLPDIFSFFTKNIKEKKMRTMIEEQLLITVIPQIKAKIREALPELLDNNIIQLISSISDQFEAEIEQKRMDIARMAKEREEKASHIEQEITKLENAKKALSSLANQYLYQ